MKLHFQDIIYKRIIIIITIINISFYCNAQTGNFKKSLNEKLLSEKLNQASLNTKSIESDFIQFKHMDILENDMESTGHFSFSTPDKVRWEYSTPYKYIIVMNTGVMWINDGKKTQKYDTETNKMFKEINDLMLGMLQGKILESKSFKSALYENDKQVLAKLIPQTPEMKEFLSEIQLYFNKTDYSVNEIKMLEQSGDFTLIKFNNKKLNVVIPNSKFTVK
jgi:outer membrane lipoprotein-sorting protein